MPETAVGKKTGGQDVKKTVYILAFILVSLMTQPCSAHAVEGFYGYKDKRGVLHLTNVQTDYRYKPLFTEKKKTGIHISRSKIYRLIEKVAYKYSVEPALVKAIVKAESDFDTFAVSSAGAQGLMQLMPETAKLLKVLDPFDPQDCIDGGVRHIRSLLTHFNNDLALAVAAYNAGKSAVIKYGGIPPYKQTKKYVRNVMIYLSEYRSLGTVMQ